MPPAAIAATAAAIPTAKQRQRDLDAAGLLGVPAPAVNTDDATSVVTLRTPRALGKATLDVSPLTEAGSVVGTPRYMAPEVASGHAAGPAADVFALGIVAFLALTGQYPFSRPPLKCVLEGLPFEELGSLARLNLGLSPTLTRALQAALSIEPSRRPSASELAEAFKHG